MFIVVLGDICRRQKGEASLDSSVVTQQINAGERPCGVDPELSPGFGRAPVGMAATRENKTHIIDEGEQDRFVR